MEVVAPDGTVCAPVMQPNPRPLAALKTAFLHHAVRTAVEIHMRYAGMSSGCSLQEAQASDSNIGLRLGAEQRNVRGCRLYRCPLTAKNGGIAAQCNGRAHQCGLRNRKGQLPADSGPLGHGRRVVRTPVELGSVAAWIAGGVAQILGSDAGRTLGC